MSNGYLDNMWVGVHQMQQQADQDVVDLVFEHGLPRAELGQVAQQQDGSTADVIVLLQEVGRWCCGGGEVIMGGEVMVGGEVMREDRLGGISPRLCGLAIPYVRACVRDKPGTIITRLHLSNTSNKFRTETYALQEGLDLHEDVDHQQMDVLLVQMEQDLREA